MTQPFVPEGTRLVVVNRGNMQMVFPLQDDHLKMWTGSVLALESAKAFIRLQRGQPKDKTSMPIDSKSRQSLALQRLNGDYLYANISLGVQFEGLWEEVDVPEAVRTEYTGKAPYVELNLVDTPLIFR